MSFVVMPPARPAGGTVPEETSRSISRVISSGADAPWCVFILNPLKCGGLWLAEITIPASAPRETVAAETAGVETTVLERVTLQPHDAAASAAVRAKAAE